MTKTQPDKLKRVKFFPKTLSPPPIPPPPPYYMVTLVLQWKIPYAVPDLSKRKPDPLFKKMKPYRAETCSWCPASVLMFVTGCKWERGKRFSLTIPAKMCVFLFLFFGFFYTVDIKQNVKKSGFCMPCETKFLAFYLHQHNKIN